TGIAEIVAFNDVYEKCRDVLKTDSVVIVSGRISSKEDTKIQIEARNVILFNNWPDYFRFLVIRLNKADIVDKHQMILDILKKFPGEKKVIFAIKDINGKLSIYEHSAPGVKFCPELILALNTVLGNAAVRVIRKQIY
ncbi:MAG: hypothetical protein N2748_06080, partial [candidate division WOR-3 bacterium]|nr:hypothetical protein [candidate division WOR-3 bacterium]